MNPGESYDPLLMSPVKSTSKICVDQVGHTFKRKIFKPGDNWDLDCVCVPFRGWMGKTKYLSAFERGMVVGARRTGLSVSRTAPLLSFSTLNSFLCVSRMVTDQRTSSQLDRTLESIGVKHWASIPVERFRYLVESMPRRMPRPCATQYFEGVHNVWYTQCTHTVEFLL